MRYVIPNFARGLVDRGAASKLDDTYASKCTELQNFYIASDNTLRRRPPIRPGASGILANLSAIDTHTVGDSTVVLADIPLNELENLPEALKKMLWMDSINPHRLPFAEVFNKSGSTYTYDTTIDGVDIRYKAQIQRLLVFNRETGQSDEEYTLAVIANTTSTNHTSRSYTGRVSVGASRALSAGSAAGLPTSVRPADIGDPVTVAIFKGNDLLSSAHTMPYRRDGNPLPSVKAAGSTDPRLTYFPQLVDSPEGQGEFIITDTDAIQQPIDHLDGHADGGITFSFAGFRYQWTEAGLVCKNGPTLLPDYSELSHDQLKTYIADEPLPVKPHLPIKVAYIPTSTEGEDFQFKLSTISAALAEGRDLVTSPATSGLTSGQAIETLLTEKKVRGFTFEAFQELFPALAPITANLKHVLGYHTDAFNSTSYMYPDIKYLTAGTDVNGAGTKIKLYTRTTTRTAMVQPSAPRVAVRPTDEDMKMDADVLDASGSSIKADLHAAHGFMTDSNLNEFPNENGFAAGGVGVTVALYRNYPTVTDQRQYNEQIANPDGIFYFFYDYDNPEVQAALDNINLVSGFSAAGSSYQSVLMRKAQTASWRPQREVATDFLGTFIRNLRFAIEREDNKIDADTTGNSFYNDLGDETPTITDRKAHLMWPFGPPTSEIKNFAVPVFMNSLNQEDSDLSINASDLGLTNLANDSSTTAPEEVAGTPVLAGGVKFNSGERMARYIAQPTVYVPASGNIHVLQGRTALSNKNKLFFSEAGFVDNFSNHIADYFGGISNAPAGVAPLRRSGLAGTAVQPRAGDPAAFSLTTREGTPDNIKSVGGPDANSILIGADKSIRRIVPGTLGGSIAFENISSAGVTSNIVFDSSFFIGAAGPDVLLAKYIREAQGFVVDILNNDTRDIGEVNSIVSLVPKHRLVLMHGEGSNVIYAFAAGGQRTFKGLSIFVLPMDVRRIKQVDADTIGLLTDTGYFEMDFTAGVDTDYRDQSANQTIPFTSAVASLPMYTMDERRFSPGTSMTVKELFMCLHGYIDLKAQIINDDTGVVESVDIRHPERSDITEVRLFSGIFPQKTLPPNGGVAPRLRLEKTDNRYISISSVVAEVK